MSVFNWKGNTENIGRSTNWGSSVEVLRQHSTLRCGSESVGSAIQHLASAGGSWSNGLVGVEGFCFDEGDWWGGSGMVPRGGIFVGASREPASDSRLYDGTMEAAILQSLKFRAGVLFRFEICVVAYFTGVETYSLETVRRV